MSEGEARVVVKAADMAEDMQQEAINVAIEVRGPVLISVASAMPGFAPEPLAPCSVCVAHAVLGGGAVGGDAPGAPWACSPVLWGTPGRRWLCYKSTRTDSSPVLPS